jgi:hypothetical protein
VTKKFSMLEVPDARFLAGDLFRDAFKSEIPSYPRHFVALYQVRPGEFRTAGYIHFSAFESVYLAGGLVIDKTLYPLLSKEDLAELGPRPSMGEYTMREGIALLTDSVAVFASIGIPRSVELNLNVGYVRTHIADLFAVWQREVPPELQRAITDRVARLLPF